MARVQNFDLDILFVRTNDVVEFVSDGVAELGVTGLDLVAESGSDVPQLRTLGYGRCRLTVAVPNDSPYRAAEDLAGLRVATSHMSLTRRFFESRDIPVDVIPVSGAAEVAPRLGLAEAIVDLVSTGSTMVVNGLRPIEEVFASEAVLLANPTALTRARRRAGLDPDDAERHAGRARPQVPDDERADGQGRGARGSAARAWSRRRSFRSPTRA